jgi:hypothetical protein
MQFLALVNSTITLILKGLKWVLGMAGRTTRLLPWVYYVLHYGLVTITTLVLMWFNDPILDFFGNATINDSHPLVQKNWVAILFLLSYVFLRLLVYFISLLWEEDEVEFLDIDHAWAAGMAGMANAGLDIRSVPVMLIHGLEEPDEKRFFRAAGFNAKVIAPEAEVRSPLRFYANQDALFITCSNVSATSSQVRARVIDRPTAAGGNGPSFGSETLKPEGIRQLVAAAGSQTLTPGQLQAQSQTATLNPAAVKQETAQMSQLLNVQELLVCERRVKYLSQLISQARSPLCAINGLLLAIPLEWTRSDADQGLHQSVRQDVGVLHESLQLMFPVVCLFTGLHQLGAVQEFVERVRKTEPRFGPDVRAGSHFPPGQPVDEASAKWAVEKGFEWFRSWIYQSFAHDLSNPSNAQLFRMLCNLESRRSGLVQMLKTAFGHRVCGEQIRLSGCYYCSMELRTGHQAFVRGVIEKLVKEQELVAYPPTRVRQDKQCRNWAVIAWVGAAILMVANIATIWLLVKS